MKRFFSLRAAIITALFFFTLTLQASAKHRSYPSPPRNVKIQQQGNDVLITWEKPINKNYVGFRIYRSQRKKQQGSLAGEVNRNTFSFLDSNVQANTTYFYTIRTVRKNQKESKNRKQNKFIWQLVTINTSPSSVCEPEECISRAENLMENPKIMKAIQMNPLVKDRDYKTILLKHIRDIETGATGEWSTYRSKMSFTEEEMLEIYLRKVAVSFHIEVHKIVPWSFLDYGDTYLQMLISDLYVPADFYISRRHALFNGNPLKILAYANETVGRYPQETFKTPKDFLDLLIRRMRDEGWGHFGFEEKKCSDFIFWDWDCLSKVKLGSSIFTAEFLYAVLQAYNIPTYEEAQYLPEGHTGIIMPTLGVSMDGNQIYETIRTGLSLRPNKVPVSLAYDNFTQYKEWKKLPICKAQRAQERQAVLNYLNLIHEPEWQTDIQAAYCFTNSMYTNTGDFLGRTILDDLVYYECQTTNPSGEKYWEPVLTGKEWNEWLTLISRKTQCQ